MAQSWQEAAGDALADAGVEVAAWVPERRLDAIVARLAARDIAVRTLTREEECVAYAAGRRLGGGRIDSQVKLGPSPFVDPALVRMRFAEQLPHRSS